MKHSSRQKHGFCALTRRPGKLVKSHIIPDALTKPSIAGSPLIQHGVGGRPSQRWSSWYDGELVVTEGEKVLSELDDWGIRELRRLKLIWSGWEHRNELELQEIFHAPWQQWLSMRHIRASDPRLLRRFFHSLLWRAAATKRPEFSEVKLSPEDLETLRQIVLGEIDAQDLFFPVYLVQHSTKGPAHNRTPFSSTLTDSGLAGGYSDPTKIRTLRFYFDGLVAHFIAETPESEHVSDLRTTLIGCHEVSSVATIPYEKSVERIGLEEILLDYNQQQT